MKHVASKRFSEYDIWFVLIRNTANLSTFIAGQNVKKAFVCIADCRTPPLGIAVNQPVQRISIVQKSNFEVICCHLGF